MATADTVYVDPSALLKLYVHEPESAAMNAWRGRTKGPLLITHHGRVEVINGICLAAFRGAISGAAHEDALASFEEDVVEGRYRPAELLWRATLTRAAELSRDYSSQFGTRTLDVLHVATALELKLRYFLTYDRRQQALVRAVGMKLVAV